MKYSILLLFCIHCGVTASGAVAEKCFKAQLTEGITSELILYDNGTYIRVDDNSSSWWHDRGTWREGSGSRFVLISDREIRQLQVGLLTVSPIIKGNLSLLNDLRKAIRRFLRSHSGEMFEPELIRAISVLGDPCSAENKFICCGTCDDNEPGNYCVEIQVEPAFPAMKVPRSDLQDLMAQIKKFKKQKDLNVFHMSTISHKNITAALWEEEGPTWPRQRIPETKVRELLDSSRKDSCVLVQIDCADAKLIQQSY